MVCGRLFASPIAASVQRTVWVFTILGRICGKPLACQRRERSRPGCNAVKGFRETPHGQERGVGAGGIEPCAASQARRRAFIAVVLHAPAGPTRTSMTRPEPATEVSAASWSSASRPPPGNREEAADPSATRGAVNSAARSSSRDSASNNSVDVNTTEGGRR